MHSRPKEQVEQHNVQPIVQSVAAGKAHKPSPRGHSLEREIAGQEEIAHKAQHIARRVGKVDIYPPLQQEVNAIVHPCRQRTDEAETHKLHQAIILAKPVYLLFYPFHSFVCQKNAAKLAKFSHIHTADAAFLMPFH